MMKGEEGVKIPFKVKRRLNSYEPLKQLRTARLCTPIFNRELVISF